MGMVSSGGWSMKTDKRFDGKEGRKNPACRPKSSIRPPGPPDINRPLYWCADCEKYTENLKIHRVARCQPIVDGERAAVVDCPA